MRVLLIIGGGIAAYKAPDLVRKLRARGFSVRCLMTAAGAQFVSALSLASVAGERVYENLFDLTDEAEMGHIQLSRDADLVLVAPATADLLAKMAHGTANDLAGTTLLATDKPIFVAPAMNVRMWHHAATQRNLAQLATDGVTIIGPVEGDMACGDYGLGRMADPEMIADTIAQHTMRDTAQPLQGRKILITAGPTHEPLDPIRYIANRSSGKQGYAIAEALRDLGAQVHLVAGPTALPNPKGINFTAVETALEMRDACFACLPVDVAICTAAVADWRVAKPDAQKMKKRDTQDTLALELVKNPDILAELAAPNPQRPKLVIGFAAETENIIKHAIAKRTRKKCDWIIANDVSKTAKAGTDVMGGDKNCVQLIRSDTDIEDWPVMSKRATAHRLAQNLAGALAQ